MEVGGEMTAFQYFEWNRLLVEEFLSDRHNRMFFKIIVYCSVEKDMPLIILPLIVQRHSLGISWFGRKKESIY